MLNPRQPVRIYWNYKHRCYSIFQDGAVRASARAVQLSAVEFRVREAARRRMVQQGRRIIHACAVGYLVDYVHAGDTRHLAPFSGTRVTYDPFRHDAFVCTDTAEAIHTAAAARFDETGMHIVREQGAAA